MNVLDQFKKITTFVFDMDGVLTDGTVFVFSGDEQVRRMSIKDGYALQLALKKGYKMLIISGGFSEAVKERLERLGITNVRMAIKDKEKYLNEYVKKYKLKWEEVLYMGDDIPDYGLMKLVGISCCPADAVGEIRDAVKYVSPFNGGLGCVRDVIEKVLKLNNDWGSDTSVASK